MVKCAVTRENLNSAGGIAVAKGYQPGVIGRCAEMHARYYSATAGFGAAFEAQVAKGMSDFIEELDLSDSGLWIARKRDAIVGTIAIQGHQSGGPAHLRWFIVDDAVRGKGVGRKLLGEAIAFCDGRGFSETELWTFDGLDAAKHLYLASGFTLVEARPGARWGQEVLEQRYTRQRFGHDLVGAE